VPRVARVWSLTVEKVDSWVGSSQPHPVLDWEVVEGKHDIELVQLFHCGFREARELIGEGFWPRSRRRHDA
jgi:hypothetical protein